METEHKKTEHHEKPVHHKEHKTSEVHHKKTVAHHSKTKSKKNSWQIATAILTILFVASVFTNGFASFDGFKTTTDSTSLSSDEIESKALEYINTQLLGGQGSAEIISVTEEGGLYAVALKVQGQEITSYVSKDGNMLFPTGLDMNEEIEVPTPTPAPVTEVETKSDKPVVELFVMSHCPYGTQIEKGMLPVALLLEDKIDFEIKFVYYAMHGELETTEQLNQYCIQKDQNELYLDYLNCFLGTSSGSKDEGKTCLEETNVDMDALSECAEVADEEFNVNKNVDDTSSYLSGRFPMFDIHKAENDEYGIKGSPSLVINGEQVSAGRDSVSLLSAVCGAFNEAPEECDTEFEVGAPGPGFGWDSTGNANVAACAS